MNDRFSADELPTKHGFGTRATPWPIDLARVRPFHLGGTEVRPPNRVLVRGEKRETLEPLVMQVLVALSSARGEIVSRDDLIDACWGGRAVTDDAVNRVISRLRAIGKRFASFEVETVTKVGYRLVETGREKAPEPDRRRVLLAAGGAIACLTGVGLWAVRRGETAGKPAETNILLQKGLAVLQNNDIIEAPDPGTSLQALALLTAATEATPDSATAWGALAVAYSVRKRAVGPADRPGLEARGRAAAKRALALDPTEARGLAALRLLDRTYGNWILAERANAEAFRMNPKIAILGAIMSNFLGGVGRWKDASSYTKGIDRRQFVIPGVEWRLLIDLWSSGDLPAADRQLRFAIDRWPQHARVWRTGLTYLMYSGRPAEVLRMLRDEKDAPIEIRPEYLATVRATAEALAGQRLRAEAVTQNLSYLSRTASEAMNVAQACVALGAADRAYSILDGYYFGEGEWSSLAPQGGDEDRITGPLFQPVMEPIWRKPAFNHLLERIGLNRYWRDSGTNPDFRQA